MRKEDDQHRRIRRGIRRSTAVVLAVSADCHVRAGQVQQARTEPVLLRQDDVRQTGTVRRQLHWHGVDGAEEPGRTQQPARRD